MPYLFETYHQLIHGDISKELNQDKLNEATSEIIQTIDRELFEVRSMEDARFYVQKIELAITHLATSIKDHLKINDSIARATLLECCHQELEEIQHHIESTYSVYRDSSKSISKKLLSTLSDSFKEKARLIKDRLDQNKINPKLQKIILSTIQDLELSDLQISRYRMDYLQEFVADLLSFLDNQASIEEPQLLQYLYVLNFNTISLLCYICEHYKSLKDQIDDEKSILAHLYESKQRLNHVPISTRKPYNPEMSDLRKQVQHWIDEEIEIVKKDVKQQRKEDLNSHGPKLKFNHSVDVISGFFRLLHDARITDSGANQTVRWINQHISSKNQPHISQQSIQRKFFEKHSNKEPLKKIVIHLLNYLNHK